MNRCLILCHRYLGIPLSVLFVVWFVSGVVMIYTGGMPALSGEERLARAPAIDLAAVRLSPAAALEAAGIGATPAAIRLDTVLGRPAYRLRHGFGRVTTVFADSGERLDAVPPAVAAEAAARFAGVAASRVRFVQTLDEPDQWTLTEQGSLPLHELAVADGKGTRLYVSATSGEVVLATTRASRGWAWVGAIPHWLYFTPLRVNQPAWYWTVVVLSALGCALALMGLVLGVTQFRRSRPFSWQKSVRYRGWMRWHYFSGAIFGLFALTWVFSGLMSMEPFGWMSESGLRVPPEAVSGGALEVDRYPALAAARWPARIPTETVKEIEYVRILGEPHLLVATAAPAAGTAYVRERLHQPYPLALERGPGRELVHAETLHVVDAALPVAVLVDRIAGAVKDASIRTHELLDEYDSYYYSRERTAPLPVLRLKFDDPLETWTYIDPGIGRIVASTHRYSRIERWLFNGLHSLDFRFWYDRRPLWDAGMILLSLGALTTSTIGMFLGIARLRRKRTPQ